MNIKEILRESFADATGQEVLVESFGTLSNIPSEGKSLLVKMMSFRGTSKLISNITNQSKVVEVKSSQVDRYVKDLEKRGEEVGAVVVNKIDSGWVVMSRENEYDGKYEPFMGRSKHSVYTSKGEQLRLDFGQLKKTIDGNTLAYIVLKDTSGKREARHELNKWRGDENFKAYNAKMQPAGIAAQALRKKTGQTYLPIIDTKKSNSVETQTAIAEILRREGKEIEKIYVDGQLYNIVEKTYKYNTEQVLIALIAPSALMNFHFSDTVKILRLTSDTGKRAYLSYNTKKRIFVVE